GLDEPFTPDGYETTASQDFGLEEKKIMTHAINSSNGKSMGDLVALVNSTYPMFLHHKVGSLVDFGEVAKIYEKSKEYQVWSSKQTTDQEWHAADSIRKF
ncbi:MAG: hypothetical protein AAFP03_06550, partial [Cyanobacteria bacterium J06598_3]